MCSTSPAKAPKQQLPPPAPPPPALTAQAPVLQQSIQGRTPSRRSGVGALRIDQNVNPTSLTSGLAIPLGV